MKNDFYVYVHRKINGEIFYVGKGRAKRAWSKTNRSKSWLDLVSKEDFVVEILYKNLTEDKSLVLEKEVILDNPNVINIRGDISPKYIPDDISSFVAYSASSPTGLVWLYDSANTKVGEPAGTKAKYWYVSQSNQRFTCHRVVWKLLKGDVPKGYVINHIDNNSFNNNIENLEMITYAENSRRSKSHTGLNLRKNNTTGFNGITIASGRQAYLATWIDLDGKLRNKYFSINKYGLIPALYNAINYREKEIAKMNQQGAGYTERHGK